MNNRSSRACRPSPALWYRIYRPDQVFTASLIASGWVRGAGTDPQEGWPCYCWLKTCVYVGLKTSDDPTIRSYWDWDCWGTKILYEFDTTSLHPDLIASCRGSRTLNAFEIALFLKKGKGTSIPAHSWLLLLKLNQQNKVTTMWWPLFILLFPQSVRWYEHFLKW